LAGFTSSSASIRQLLATCSSAFAAASTTASSPAHTPSPSPATSSGVDSDHTDARGWRPCVAGTKTPRPRWARSCTGEPLAPTTITGTPRRTASSRLDSVSSVDPLQDTATTRSATPTQPGSP
jgi:hypothetical protein